jgi:hypothetical protein
MILLSPDAVEDRCCLGTSSLPGLTRQSIARSAPSCLMDARVKPAHDDFPACPAPCCFAYQAKNGGHACDKTTRRANHFGFTELRQAPGSKINRFTRGANHRHIGASHPKEGRLAIVHERCGEMRWTRSVRETGARDADGEGAWS